MTYSPNSKIKAIEIINNMADFDRGSACLILNIVMETSLDNRC